MFTAAELADMRAVAATALPDAATISRPTRTVDDTGGTTEQTSVVASNVACRVNRERPREVTQGDKTVILAEWIVTLPYGTNIRAGDVVTIGAQTLHVVGLFTGSWRTTERALCTG